MQNDKWYIDTSTPHYTVKRAPEDMSVWKRYSHIPLYETRGAAYRARKEAIASELALLRNRVRELENASAIFFE